MDKDEQIQELKNDCKRLAAELDYIGVADEELMYPELYKRYLREPEQSLETRPNETFVIGNWQMPDEFGLYKIFDDGSFEFLHDVLFWALIPTNTKNEIHLCGVDESGLYGYDTNIEDRYDTGWSLEDVKMCMRYDKKDQ